MCVCMCTARVHGTYQPKLVHDGVSVFQKRMSFFLSLLFDLVTSIAIA